MRGGRVRVATMGPTPDSIARPLPLAGGQGHYRRGRRADRREEGERGGGPRERWGLVRAEPGKVVSVCRWQREWSERTHPAEKRPDRAPACKWGLGCSVYARARATIGEGPGTCGAFKTYDSHDRWLMSHRATRSARRATRLSIESGSQLSPASLSPPSRLLRFAFWPLSSESDVCQEAFNGCDRCHVGRESR